MKDPVSVVQRFHCIKRWFHVSSSISQDSVSPMNCTCRAMLTFYLQDCRSTSRCCSSTLWNVRVEREGWPGKAGNREGVWGEEGCGKEREEN